MRKRRDLLVNENTKMKVREKGEVEEEDLNYAGTRVGVLSLVSSRRLRDRVENGRVFLF